MAENYDRLWKIWGILEILNRTFSKCYNPSENLATDEIIVLFKGRVICRQYIPKKHKCCSIKVYKFCDSTVYTYAMKVYFHGTKLDRNSCHSDRTDKEDRRMWLQIVHGQNLFLP